MNSFDINTVRKAIKAAMLVTIEPEKAADMVLELPHALKLAILEEVIENMEK